MQKIRFFDNPFKISPCSVELSRNKMKTLIINALIEM